MKTEPNDESMWSGLKLPLYRTAQAAVASQLRHEILSGHLPPGSRLIQSDVARRMGVSTTPVREALRELLLQGLLDGDPHRGLVVHEPTAQELTDVYELRELLEPFNIRKAVENITPEQLALAAELVERMERETDAATWVELNEQFHRVIAASANVRLMSFLETLRNIASLYVGVLVHQSPDQLARANQQHREMVQACRDGDAEGAAKSMQQHVHGSWTMVQRLLETEEASR